MAVAGRVGIFWPQLVTPKFVRVKVVLTGGIDGAAVTVVVAVVAVVVVVVIAAAAAAAAVERVKGPPTVVDVDDRQHQPIGVAFDAKLRLVLIPRCDVGFIRRGGGTAPHRHAITDDKNDDGLGAQQSVIINDSDGQGCRKKSPPLYTGARQRV